MAVRTQEKPAYCPLRLPDHRAGKHPANFLAGFKGYLQTDGYSGYGELNNVSLLLAAGFTQEGKFTKALKALPAEHSNKPVVASAGLNCCNQFFAIERQLKNLPDKQQYEKRVKLSKPVLDDSHVWLKKQRQRALPKSILGRRLPIV